MPEANVIIRSSLGTDIRCCASYASAPPWFIEIDFGKLSEKRYSGADLFECLDKIRQELEKDGHRVLCNGSRVDTYPSSMLRQMGGAKQVYRLTMGKPALNEDLLDLWGTAAYEQVGTVSEQRSYFQRWLNSLRS